ncbi:dephospho-CoA kinase [Catenibacillus scindens]|uniref:Dephospho-CoA kinase n=1 Tax=Catenibacillus scindens TaxID=673271 RepID=A0A7W8H8P0_9FIRM|nr:dephospho-CoA kinase [Catenibacillus scindens]MBB5263807.1 dephospho-CoA kinase [Catenibacillus scindens]
MRTKVIGIIGGAGSGKTVVLKIMEEKFGARVIIADEVARKLSMPGGESYEKIVAFFGRGILMDDGTIDRGKLAAIVFNHRELLDKLNGIVHPDVRAAIEKEIKDCQGVSPLVVLEAALLVECGYRDICDEFWYVHSDEAVRRKRMKETRGYSDEKIDSILRNQLSEKEFLENSDRVLENNSDIENLEKEIEKNLI